MRQIGTGRAGTESARLLELNGKNGAVVQVLDTNAEPVWEDDEAFAATLEYYGL